MLSPLTLVVQGFLGMHFTDKYGIKQASLMKISENKPQNEVVWQSIDLYVFLVDQLIQGCFSSYW